MGTNNADLERAHFYNYHANWTLVFVSECNFPRFPVDRSLAVWMTHVISSGVRSTAAADPPGNTDPAAYPSSPSKLVSLTASIEPNAAAD
jgi:hypothetical protein